MPTSVSAFQIDGNPISCERYGFGHINETYLLQTDRAHAYILQKINEQVFHNVPALMHNIASVTRHLAKADPTPRHVLTLISTKDGAPFHVDEAGSYWRIYDFVTDSLCLQKADSNEDFYESAVAFGTFQNLLADFPAETLHETIPRFHDTPNRYLMLHEAILADAKGRVKEAQDDIAFALAREAEASALISMLHRGELPLRVTHNDTKLNNVMLDAKTRKALCVIDLDTVMPGLAANDFGDSIRFGSTTSAEDEKDLSKVNFSLSLYESYVKGFLGACGARLTDAEIATLPMGAKLMTLECGVRFLTDFLVGDSYFHTNRPGQNLDRCRTQFKLVHDMEAHWAEMNDVVKATQRELLSGI